MAFSTLYEVYPKNICWLIHRVGYPEGNTKQILDRVWHHLREKLFINQSIGFSWDEIDCKWNIGDYICAQHHPCILFTLAKQ